MATTSRMTMAKRRLKLHVRIPPYRPDRNSWRRQLHRAILKRQKQRRVRYRAEDILELEVRLYMRANDLRSHDVDNRLKDVMDALQGRAGGPKSQHSLAAVIPNDRQVYRVIVEKAPPPGQSKGNGHLTVRRMKRPQWAGAI